tara:strand:+ start:362 stop:1129 length:768 start_codon:yes stop_codon:yes gene_type:complete
MKIVIKIGSSLVTSESEIVDKGFLKKISVQIDKIRSSGHEVILVSSGAIAFGMKVWNLTNRPENVEKLQALSAVGQIGLINSYQEEFKSLGLFAAQVLLSHEDFNDNIRSKNLKESIKNILDIGAIPIINENDSVSTEEIEFGDNDQLSGNVAKLVRSELLIILTDQAGVYDKDPSSNEEAELYTKINFNNVDNLEIELGDSGKYGRGGMKTKFLAAENFLEKNNKIYIANGRTDDILIDILAGKEVGTLIKLDE